MSSAERKSTASGAPVEKGGEHEELRWRIEVEGELDRQRIESLFLDIRRLAARHAGGIIEFKIRKA